MRNILRLLPYLRGSERLLAAVLTLAMLSQVTLLLLPKVIQQIIRNALQHTPGNIAPWALLIIVLAVVKGALSASETILGTKLGQQVLFNLRQEIYAHLVRLRLRFFDRTRSGELLSRVTADLEPIDGFFSWGSRLIFRNSLLFIGVLVFTFSMNVKLTLVSLSIVPLITLSAFIMGARIRPTWQAAREQVGNFTSALEETLSGIRVVKMSTQEKREIEKLTRASAEIRDKTWRSNRIDAAYYPITGLWAGLAGMMILAYGGSLVIAGQLTLDQFVAFQVYLVLLLVPMRMLGWMVSGMQRAAVGAGRIFELMAEPQEELMVQSSQFRVNGPKVPPNAQRATNHELRATNHEQRSIDGSITFDNVTFAYRENEPVLCDIELEVKAGEMVGLLGPTGSGKSALVALIPRFYDPQQGQVLIDGRDVKDYDLRRLRRQIGVVFQEPFLFSGAIGENIAFGRPGAAREEIEQAARLAALDDFINSLEKGYETLIGERGLNLSGGQQQRLALARTLLMDPRILILDDYTSSVDAYTEFNIQQALLKYMPGRTTFIISQRASSVSIADRIVVLDRGEIVEQGRPEELAQLPGGHYRKLLEVQSALGIGAED